MKEIRICDNSDCDLIIPRCGKTFGIEIDAFCDPAIVNSPESDGLVAKYRSALEGFAGGISLHAPCYEINLGTKNAPIREVTMRTFNYAYRVAKELGATEVIVHNGFVPNTSFYRGWVARAVEFWREFFCDKDDSITMLVENQCEEDSEVFLMELDALNDRRLKVCLDIGHAHANSFMTVEAWIRTLGDRIGYLHLHNNHGRVQGRPSFMNDEHNSLTNGTIDIKSTLALLESVCPDAIWSLEFAYDDASMSLLRELGYIK